MNAENMREFKFRVQYELKDGTRGWLHSPTDVSNSHIFDLKNAGNRNRVTDVPEIVDGKRTGNDLIAAIVEESFGQWTTAKTFTERQTDIYDGDILKAPTWQDEWKVTVGWWEPNCGWAVKDSDGDYIDLFLWLCDHQAD